MNIFYESNEVLKNLKKGDIVKITYPSGNSCCFRIHENGSKLIGCAMQWDNLATEEINTNGMFELIESNGG